jgi:hypothetical protein
MLLIPKSVGVLANHTALPSLCGGSLASRAIFLKTKLFFLKPCRGTVDIFCKHLSPGDEQACHPNPESLRQVERNPFNAGATIWRTTAAKGRGPNASFCVLRFVLGGSSRAA